MKLIEFLSKNSNLHNFFIDDYEAISEIMSLFALEIAEEAYEEGSFYQSGLNNEIKQNYLNKEQYLEKLKNEL